MDIGTREIPRLPSLCPMTLSRRQSLTLWLILTGGIVLLLFGYERLFQEEANYTPIEDRLYLGGAVAKPPRGTQAVLNLCESEDRYRCSVHIWEPMVDNEPAPSLDWLRRMVGILDNWQREGLTTYVHCLNGVSRSGMVVIAYEMHKNHWSRDEALEFVRAKRPIVRPNPAFMQRLLEWERVVKEDAITSSATFAR